MRPNVAAATATVVPRWHRPRQGQDQYPPPCGAANHRDRAAGETVERIFAHERHHAAADDILQNDHHNAQNKEHDDGFAALEQHRNADGEADGRKEEDHKDRLQCVVKGDDRRARGIEDGVEDLLKHRPPTRGAGMQKRLNTGIFFVSTRPRAYMAAPSARAWYILSWISVMCGNLRRKIFLSGIAGEKSREMRGIGLPVPEIQ